MDSRLSRLFDDLQMQLPGALLPAIQIELKNTLREFFIDTNTWIEEVRIKTKPNTILYDIGTNNSVPVRLLSLQNADGSYVRYATMPEMGTLLLAHAPSNTERWNAKVAATVPSTMDKEGNPLFPKWVLDRYYDAILAGVLARMMSQSAKPYANPQMAMFYLRRYTSEKSKAKHEGNMQNTYGGQRWRFPAFA